MRKMKVIIFAIGLMAVALMAVGCGDGNKTPSKAKADSELAKAIDGDSSSVLSDATHSLVGTMTVLNEVDYRAIAPADYSGQRKSAPKVQVSMKVNTEGFIEKAVVIVLGEDNLGIYKYKAQKIASQEFVGHLLSNGYFAVTLFDNFEDAQGRQGHINLTGQIEGDTLTGAAVLDGHEDNVLGNIDLKINQISTSDVEA
jgi:hypothetical protein